MDALWATIGLCLFVWAVRLAVLARRQYRAWRDYDRRMAWYTRKVPEE